MNERYKRYSRNKFKDWKKRVSNYLPGIAVKFYSFVGYIDHEKHKLLGTVIREINNPSYALIDTDGKRMDYQNQMACEIILELQVSELFAFVNKLSLT